MRPDPDILVVGQGGVAFRQVRSGQRHHRTARQHSRRFDDERGFETLAFGDDRLHEACPSRLGLGRRSGNQALGDETGRGCA